MKFSSAITILLLLAFGYFAWAGGLFVVVLTWSYNTWALIVLVALIAWVSRNEFGAL